MSLLRSPSPTACTIRGIFRCSLFLGMVGFVAAAIGAHALWRKTDKLIEAALLAQIQERVPDWDLEFKSAKADWSGKVRVREIVLNGTDGRPLVEIPEMLLELDMDLLLQSQKVLVERVRITEPIVRLRCYDAVHWKDIAAWNCSLPAPKPSETAPPDVIVVGAGVLVQLIDADSNVANEFRAAGIRVTSTPDSRHGYSTELEGQVQHVGRIEATARADFAHGAFEVRGQCGQIDLGGLVQSVLGVSPTARDQIASLAALSETTRRNRAIRLASAGDPLAPTTESPATGNPLEDLGVQADLSVEFRASRLRKDQPVNYSVVAEVRDGQVTNPNIPAPLYGLKGHIAVNQDGLVIRNLMASNGDRRLNIDGHWEFRGENPERRFNLQASELSIGPEVRSYLPAPLQAKYDQLEPQGKFKIDVEYNSAFTGLPIKVRELSVVDGSVRHALFPYRVTGIRGGVKQEAERFQLDFQGIASGRDIVLKGSLAALSADAALQLEISVKQLPFDNELLRAFAESEQPALVKLYPVLESLRATGTADWDLELSKPGGEGQKFRLAWLRGNVSQGVLNYQRFPYPLSNVTGTIQFDREEGNVWKFLNLRGVHGSEHGVTQVSGEGSFALDPAPGRLDLSFTALNVPLDLDLQQATVKALPAMQQAWEELAPTGSADLKDLSINWTPGAPVVVLMPSIQLKEVRIKPKRLPFAWDHLNGAAEWDGRRVIVRKLYAYHNESYLNIEGVDPADPQNHLAYFELTPGGPAGWRLHLQEVTIKKLSPDDDLRSALPPAIRDIVRHANPTLPFDLQLGIDLKGAMESDVVTAHWTAEAAFHGGDLTLGVLLQNIRGTIGTTSGTYDGQTVSGVGWAAFEQATILSLPVTDLKTPFQFEGSKLSVGTPAWDQLPASNVKPNFAGRPLRANLYGGTVAADATAMIDPLDSEKTSYVVQLNVENVQLEAIARANQWRERLLGSIRGFVSLRGTGSNAASITTDDRTTNWVQIQPARLLDLPVFVRLFDLLSFNPGENFMFNSAYGEFKLRNAQFDFSKIVLDGTSLSLIGRGTVGYLSKGLDLVFYTQARNSVPVVRLFVEAVGKNWVEIAVRGTTDDPVVTQSTRLPIVTPAIKLLMDSVDRGQSLRPMQRPTAP